MDSVQSTKDIEREILNNVNFLRWCNNSCYMDCFIVSIYAFKDSIIYEKLSPQFNEMFNIFFLQKFDEKFENRKKGNKICLMDFTDYYNIYGFVKKEGNVRITAEKHSKMENNYSKFGIKGANISKSNVSSQGKKMIQIKHGEPSTPVPFIKSIFSIKYYKDRDLKFNNIEERIIDKIINKGLFFCKRC